MIMITMLDSEQESILEKNIVWICASPRSGTTWLSRDLLLSHQTILLNEFHLDEHLGVPTIGVFDDTFKRRIDRHKDESSYFFSAKYKETWNFYLRKMILNRIHAQCQNLSKKIIIKEPSCLGAYDIISECVPCSKMIMLLRDGRDIIDSFVDALGSDGFISNASGYIPVTKSNRLAFIEMRCKLWNNLVETMLRTSDNHSKEMTLIIKYEELRIDTTNVLKRIYDFIGIQMSDEILQKIVKKFSFDSLPPESKGKGKFYRSATPGKWKENFTIDEQVVINKLMEDSLRKLGYIV